MSPNRIVHYSISSGLRLSRFKSWLNNCGKITCNRSVPHFPHLKTGIKVVPHKGVGRLNKYYIKHLICAWHITSSQKNKSH